ncbi:MAG: hypothetical protein K8E24_004830 [Methanobacterium paludis]|nr:hypothetical protein [Methanobacterium paludis]
MHKKLIGGVVVLIVLLLVIVAANSGSSSTEPILNVSNIKASNVGYGMYEIRTNVTPLKDFDYLEMATTYYDKNGSVIDKNSSAWNINHAKANHVLKVSNMKSFYKKGKPAKVEVQFFDSPRHGGGKSSAIYCRNVTL